LSPFYTRQEYAQDFKIPQSANSLGSETVFELLDFGSLFLSKETRHLRQRPRHPVLMKFANRSGVELTLDLEMSLVSEKRSREQFGQLYRPVRFFVTRRLEVDIKGL
jgi:hypothetical protein